MRCREGSIGTDRLASQGVEDFRTGERFPISRRRRATMLRCAASWILSWPRRADRPLPRSACRRCARARRRPRLRSRTGRSRARSARVVGAVERRKTTQFPRPSCGSRTPCRLRQLAGRFRPTGSPSAAALAPRRWTAGRSAPASPPPRLRRSFRRRALELLRGSTRPSGRRVGSLWPCLLAVHRRRLTA